MKQTKEAQQAKAANVAREVPLCMPAASPSGGAITINKY